MRGKTIALSLLLLALLAAPALAAEIDGFQPGHGAPGDLVLIRGSEFAEDPTVSFGSWTADVLKSRDDGILCRVPSDATTGAVTVSVDAASAATDFTVVAAGTPIVLELSAEKGTADMPVFVFGRRLRGCSVSFVDASDVEQASVNLKGGRRAACFRIPEDLAAGTYTLVFENADGQDTGAFSPTFEVAEAGDGALTAVDPESPAPGARIVIEGTDLFPPGPCKIVWTDADAETTTWYGFSNGYDQVRTVVPFTLTGGATYDVTVKLHGQDALDAIEVTLGEAPAPSIEKIEPATGPSGSVFTIRGEGFCVYGEKPAVSMSDGTTSTDAQVLYKHKRGLVCMVPKDLADGDYDVTVTVGDQTSESETFTVGALPLSVDKMVPTTLTKWSKRMPVYILGSGFGSEAAEVALAVAWDDGTDTYEGTVLYRTDRTLVVRLPGTKDEPLPTGTYTVTVILDPDGTPETAEAGTFTVP